LVQQLRANVQEKKDVVERIENLLELLRSNAEDIVNELEDIGPEEYEILQEQMRRTGGLKRRVDLFMRYMSPK